MTDTHDQLDAAIGAQISRENFVSAIAERLGIIWDACHAIPDESTLVNATFQLGEVWQQVQQLEAVLVRAENALKAGDTMLTLAVQQRDDLLAELDGLRRLERAVERYDLQDERVRELVADALKNQGDYYEAIEEIQYEDRFDWLRDRLANKLGIGKHTATDLTDLLLDDWTEITPEHAQQFIELLEDVRKTYRGWQ